MKAVLVHGLLAVLGLGFAYQTWTREPDVEEAPGAITVADCREDNFERMLLETQTSYIEVQPKREKDQTEYWIAFTRKVKEPAKPDPAKAGDAGVAAAEEPKPAEEKPKPKVFLANPQFQEYMKRVMPLRAVQGLGELPKDKLDAFGFDEIEVKLEVECGDKKVAMEAGDRTFGSGHRYVRDAKSKTAYLFADTLVTDLQSAQFKYMQNDMHRFGLLDVESATVDVRGTKKKLLHRDRKLPDRATWVDANEPSRRNELYGNWFSRVARLKAREYLDDGAQPGSDLTDSAGELTPVVRIEYEVDGKPNGTMELVKVDVSGKPYYYARSDTTGRWVTVFESAAKEIEQDAAMVVGLEEAPPSKTEPAKAEATETTTSVHGAAPHALPAGHPTVPGHGGAMKPAPGAPAAPTRPAPAQPKATGAAKAPTPVKPGGANPPSGAAHAPNDPHAH